jgi:hypothetical protein
MAAGEDCLGANCTRFTDTTQLIANTTLTTDCTAVHVSCPDSIRQRLANLANVYTCNDGTWRPFAPRPCVDDDAYSTENVGVIIGCTVGSTLCLLVIILSIYLIVKTRQQDSIDLQRDMMRSEKQRRIHEFRMSTAAYNEGCYQFDEQTPDELAENSLFEQPSRVYQSTDQREALNVVAIST